MSERETLIEKLKEVIRIYKEEGNNLNVPREKFPEAMRLMINRVITIDKKEGKRSTINSVIGETGFYREGLKGEKITIESLKKEIDEYVKSGGSIFESKRTLPYYERLNSYRKKTGLSSKEIYKLCGYDYDNSIGIVKVCDCEILAILDKVKDENNYIDNVFELENGNRLFRLVRARARQEEVSTQEYLMFMYGLRMKSTMENTNYIEAVGSLLDDYASEFGKSAITRKMLAKNNPALLNKIRHLSEYFPEGSVTFHQLLRFYGYDNSTNKSFSLKNTEEKYLELLVKKYPDRVINDNFYETYLYGKAVSLALKNDMTIKQYFNMKGFKYDDGYEPLSIYRLSKMTFEVENEDIYYEISEYREKLLEKYDYDNVKDNKEKDFILNKAFNECKEKYKEKVILKPKI